MKKILKIIVISLSIFGYSQSPIYDINGGNFLDVEGAYYKDMDNFLNQFVGTWVYTDGVKTIRYRFVKKEMVLRESNINCYVDVLIGEMQYIENGVEKINSLNNLNNNYTNYYDYSLVGSLKVNKYWYPKCDECPSNIKTRLAMHHKEPNNDDFCLSANFVMHRVNGIGLGVHKIKVQYQFENSACGFNKSNLDLPSTTTNFIIPFGDYILTKE